MFIAPMNTDNDKYISYRMSPLTAHNKIFGWVHCFYFTENSAFSGRGQLADVPYPIIIATPSVKQCWNNWNIADTGMWLAAVTASIFLAYPLAFRSSHSIIQKKVLFFRMMGLSAVYGFILGLRNSCYRLQGLVPNGLESDAIKPQVKYDFTSEFLSRSFWGYLFTSPKGDQE